MTKHWQRLFACVLTAAALATANFGFAGDDGSQFGTLGPKGKPTVNSRSIVRQDTPSTQQQANQPGPTRQQVEEQRQQAEQFTFLQEASFKVLLSAFDAKTLKPVTAVYDGQNVAFEILSEEDGYFYLFNQNTEGQITVLYPEDSSEDNSIKAKTARRLPASTSYSFKVEKPFGYENNFVIVTKERVDLDKGLATTNDGVVESLGLLNFEKTIVREDKNKYGAGIAQLVSFETQEQSVAYTTNFPRTFYIGIGIDVYKNANPLPTCVNDVKDFAQLLLNRKVVHDDECVYILTNEQATKEKIYRTLSEVANNLRPGDRVVIFWSGHGATASKKAGKVALSKNDSVLSQDDLEAVFVLSDSELNQMDTFFDPEKLNVFSNVQNVQVLFVFDTCFSGAALDPSYKWDNVFKSEVSAKSIGGVNLGILASSAKDQPSLVATSIGKNSLMTHYMIDYLRKNQNASAKDLAKEIAPQVQKYAKERFSTNQSVWYVDSYGKDKDGFNFQAL